MELLDRFQLEILAQVVLAMVLGGAIGFERELRDKPAGLRTHMFVTGAATLLVAFSDVMIEHFRVDLGSQVVQADPIRIIEAVITGVSFLGAGTIIRHRGQQHIEGLTTAASLLFSVGVGVCVALWQLVLAGGLTALALLTLRGVNYLEQRLANRPEKGEA